MSNPMAEYLYKLQLIVSNTEFKDGAEAAKYETTETKLNGNAYVRAILKTDGFTSYQYSELSIVLALKEFGYTNENYIEQCLKHYPMIPPKVQQYLMNGQREILIAKYVERNPYYARISGQPFAGRDDIPADEVVIVPDGFFQLYQNDGVFAKDTPVHELPSKYIELFMNSKYYTQVLQEHPNLMYLRYLGSKSVPIEIARQAKDGDIMRIQEEKMKQYHPKFGNVTVTPDIINLYVNQYHKTRDYVYYTLRGNFGSFYENYDSFIRFLTIYLSIGNTLSVYMKQTNVFRTMNEAAMHEFFVLYGLPSVVMEGNATGEFLKKLRLLLMDKGTNTVYRVKDIIGYEYTDIYTLIMVKQQKFVNGYPVYKYDEERQEYVPLQEIVFRRLGTTEDNTSYFQFKNSNVTYSLDEVTSGDPRWWNAQEVEQALSDMNYTLSNSKYIQISTHMSSSDIWWQTVILLRALLDNRNETINTTMSLDYNLNGITELPLFDAILCIVILMNWQLNLKGNMYTSNGTNERVGQCVDMLFDGLYGTRIYRPTTEYDAGDLLYLDRNAVYIVKENYISSNGDPITAMNQDISMGKLELTNITPGQAKPFIEGQPFKIAAFNYDFLSTDKEYYNATFIDPITRSTFLEPDVLVPMLENVLYRKTSNLGESVMTEVKAIYQFIVNKVLQAKTISEFREISTLYEKLFLVDPIRNTWFDQTAYNPETELELIYGITPTDYASMRYFFYESIAPDLTIQVHDHDYALYISDILNDANVVNITVDGDAVFTDPEFVDTFYTEIQKYKSAEFEKQFPQLKTTYQSIIEYKVRLDLSNTTSGPKSFESLLIRSNPQMYQNLQTIRNSQEQKVLMLRSIIKSLERYVNSNLAGLESGALGEESYVNIIKEVISYFKSYMVEFTKDEFKYIFGGILDNGGNVDMLHLYDEIKNIHITHIVQDSATLYDVSQMKQRRIMKDDNVGMSHDDALFRMKATYQNLLSTGYEIWYDDGNRITTTPFAIDMDTEIVADIFYDIDDSAYKMIININNLDVIPPNYYGNTR